MAAELKTPLAVALFEAYSRNCGHSPDEHFDRNAAEQWMTQALDECGVAELIAADEVYDIALSRYFAAFSDGPHGDFGEQREAQTMLRVAKDRRAAALARAQGGA